MATNFPNSPSDGYIWWFGDNVKPYIWSASKGAWTRRAGTALPRNYLTNPAFNVSEQNGMTDTGTTNVHLAEQWTNQHITSVGTVRAQRVASTTPRGGKYRLRLSMTVGDPTLTGDWLAVGTTLEGNKMASFNWGVSTGQWGVLRFGCRAPEGGYVVAIRNSAVTRSFISPFWVSASQANQDHVQVMAIPPCETGVWANDNTAWGFIQWVVANANFTSTEWEWLNGNYAGGSSLTNTFMQTAGNTFELFDVGFYLDPNITNTQPEYQTTNLEDDLVDCQRYWYLANGLHGIINTATTANRCAAPHPVPMRAQPGLSLVGSTLRLYDGAVAPNITAVANSMTTSQHIECVLTAAAGGLTVGRPGYSLADGNAAIGIACNARM